METGLSPSENIIPLLTIGLLVVLIFALTTIMLFFISRKKIAHQKIVNQNLQLKHQSSLIQHNLLVQENERKRIAQNLHDELGSKLNLVVMNLHKMRDGNWQDAFTQVLNHTNEAIVSSRKISHELMPPVLEKIGLIEALEELAYQYNQSQQIQIRLLCDDANLDFSQTQRLNLYRICQELINNSIKHGKAKMILIDIFKEDEQIIFDYKDNGIGLQSSSTSNKGMGTMNIENRVDIIKGQLTVSNNDPQGVHYMIKLAQHGTD